MSLLLLPFTLFVAVLRVIHNPSTRLSLATGTAQMGLVLFHALLLALSSLSLFHRSTPTPKLLVPVLLATMPVIVVRTLRVAFHHASHHASRNGVFTHSQRLFRLGLLRHIPADRLNVRVQHIHVLLGELRALVQLP